jgi:hypothetical protein
LEEKLRAGGGGGAPLSPWWLSRPPTRNSTQPATTGKYCARLSITPRAPEWIASGGRTFAFARGRLSTHLLGLGLRLGDDRAAQRGLGRDRALGDGAGLGLLERESHLLFV